MLKVTLRGIRAHLVRFMLTAFAVTLGVALVAGTFVLTDSIDKTFDDLITQSSTGVDVQVRGAEGVSGTVGGPAVRAGLPLELQERLEAVAGVARAAPDLQGTAVLVGKDGTPVRNGGAPTLGFAFLSDDPALSVVRGRGPRNAREVAVERTTLVRSGWQVGDRTQALIGGAPGEVTIVGEVLFDGPTAGSTLLLVDPASARAQWAPDGRASSFSVTADAGLDPQTLRARLAAAVPEADVVTGEQFQQEVRDEIDQVLGFISIFLLIFALVSLLVGAFIIFNTFAMLVAQRTRELALLRVVGASRGQILRVVLGEAVALGVVGSLLGIGLGVGLATGLQALVSAGGLEIEGGLPVLPRTVAVSLGVGVTVTLLAAVLPAVRAARVAPVSALRDDVAVPAGGLRLRGAIGALMLVLGAALVVPTVLSDDVRWVLVGAGAALLLLGTLVAAPLAAQPVVRAIAKPFTVRGIVGTLARENALRNPRRTALTASALTIGLALMGALSVIAASTKASVSDLVESQLTADYVLNGGQAPFPPTVARAVQALPSVSSVATIGFVEGTLAGDSIIGIAADPVSLASNVTVAMVSGALTSSSPQDVYVSQTVARDRGLALGDTVTAGIGTLRDQSLTVRGVFEDNQVLNDPGVIFSRELYTQAVPPALQGDFLLYVKAAPGSDPVALRAQLTDAVRPFIIVSVQDADEFTSSQAEQVNVILSILYALLALAVVIAVLGIVNTLALAVYERTREIGLLRAIGMSRRQIRRMITIESITTAVFGAVLGLVLGLALGLIVQRGLRSEGLESLAIPWGTIIAVLVASAIAGVLAAILPAWRAVRIDVLRAITTD